MPKLAIFAAFDKDEIVDDYVVFYIKELAKSADVIAVFDNALSEKEREKIAPFCLEILAAKHGEYDFGSYKRGFIYAKQHKILANYDKLVLCNDSVFGPFYSFEQIFAQIPNDENLAFGFYKHLGGDASGWTNGRYQVINEHLQSYFVVIPRLAFLSEWFEKFMHSIQKDDKIDIIFKYEIGMSTLLQTHGVKLSAYIEHLGDLVNTKHLEVLDKYDGFFIKKSFINHYDFNGINKMLDFIDHKYGGGGNYDINLIISHYRKLGDKLVFIRQSELDKFKSDSEKFKNEAQKFHRLSKKIAKFAKFIPIKSTRNGLFKRYCNIFF